MRQIAKWITDVLARPDDTTVLERVRGGVRELCEQFPAPAEDGSRHTPCAERPAYGIPSQCL